MDKPIKETKPIEVLHDEKFTSDELTKYSKYFDKMLEVINERNMANETPTFDEVFWNLAMDILPYDREHATTVTIAEHMKVSFSIGTKLFNHLRYSRKFTNGLGLTNEILSDESWEASRFVECMNVISGILGAQITSSGLAAISNHPVALQMNDYIDFHPTMSFLNTLMSYRKSSEFAGFSHPELAQNYLIAINQITNNYVRHVQSQHKDK